MSVSDILDVDGLRVGPCMVRGYIERIAKLEQERDNALAMMGKWISHEGHVCPSCGMPDDNMLRLKDQLKNCRNDTLERAAEIVESLRNYYASPSWNDALDEAAEAIRSEIE